MSVKRLEASTSQSESAKALKALQEFEVSYLTKNLHAAIQHARASVDALPEGDEERAGGLTILGVALQRRYQTSAKKDICDIKDSVNAIRESLVLRINGAHKADPGDYFENLARGLKFYCTESGDLSQVEEAVKMLDEIIIITGEGTPYRALALKALCDVCNFSYERTQELQYLDKGIKTTRDAVSIIPEQHPLRQVMLERLHDLLDEKFLQKKSISDLDAKVSVTRELLNLKSDGDQHQLMLLHNLAASFDKRYDLTKDDADSEEAIAYRVTAVKMTMKDDSHDSVADRLAALKLANEQGREKFLIQKDVLLYNLRNSLRTYFDQTGNIPEIDEAVLDIIHVENLMPEGCPNPTEWRSRIGDAFQTRFKQSGRLVDLEYSIICVTRAMQSTNDSYDGWEDLEDCYRERYRIWSEYTGKMPESEISMLLFGGKQGGTWIPSEVKGGLGLSVPYMIFTGDLDDEVDKEPDMI